MKMVALIALVLLIMVGVGQAATPTATATTTATATATATATTTPTPAMNCIRSVGPWCAPLAVPTPAGAPMQSGGLAWNGDPLAATYGNYPSSFCVSGALAGLASTAAATLLQSCIVAPAAGHFTQLEIVTDLNGTTCTTAPTYNVRDNTGATNGTALAGGTSAGAVNQAQTLTFALGDVICLARTANGGTCSTPFFSVCAQVAYP